MYWSKITSFTITILIFWTILSLNAQDQKKYTVDGYLTMMPQMSWTTINIDTISQFERSTQQMLHNRLNFHWYPSEKISASVQFRNQLLWGDYVSDANDNGTYKNGFQTESYFLPLTYMQTFRDAGLLSLSTDRMWVQYTHNNLEIKVGRQRINWGQTFVWNPNDIFNTYNFFDFDYSERPGADAVRAIYYPNYTSTIEVAAKLDSASNLTAAGLFRFNAKGIDFQFIGGYYSQPTSISSKVDKDADWIAGMAITGDYFGISLRTEATFMTPTTESANKDDLFLWSTGLDYSFSNELFISTEFLYSSHTNLTLGSSLYEMYSGPLTVKNMAFAKYSGFLQGSYPITPLFNITLSGMIYADKDLSGYFIGPYLDYSIKDNLDLGLYFQFFYFETEILNYKINSNTSFAFLRLQWSF